MKTITKNPRPSATLLRTAITLCLMLASIGTWAQTTPQPTPRYGGALTNSDRKINSISLRGTTTPQQTITCGEDAAYINKTSEHFIIREGETSTATFSPNVDWMHDYIYIDKNQNGTYDNIALGTNGVPTASSELVAFSAYQVNGTYRNSSGAVSGNNPNINPPAFTAPSTAGIYYMRYVSDWNCIDPYGSSSDFQKSSGVAIDVTLWVVKEYTLVLQNAPSGVSIKVDGGVTMTSTDPTYNANGTVLSTNANLTTSDIQVTASLPSTTTVNGTTITIDFVIIEPTDLTLTTTSPQKVYVGQTSTIEYTLAPSNCYEDIRFSSDATGIATVNAAGVISGVAPGQATITVTAYKSDGTTTAALTGAVTVDVWDKCATPTFVQNGEQITLSCTHPATGVTIYYTTDGTTPSSTNGTAVASGTTISTSYGTTIKATAVASGNWDPSDVLILLVSERPTGAGTAADPYMINSAEHLNYFSQMVNEGGAKASAHYKVSTDISVSSYTTPTTTFTGTFDGGFFTIDGLTEPLVDQANGATIKNVILDDVSISSGTNVGAIANEASGDARIYNCGVLATTGSSISGSGNVGSIVGTLSGNARVLNCFSYADVSGGTVGGIVGSNSRTALNRNTILNGSGSMVFNCIFFGTVSGTNKYPVFGGNTIENVYNTSNAQTTGINTYNYFLYDGTAYTSVNSAAGVADKSLLNRFDMYRGILNSHRDLCAMYINNTQSLTADQKQDIALWLYNPADKETAPYLQLEPCATNTRRTLDRTIPNETEAYKGKQVGTVNCTFSINGKTFTETLPMTDMNTANWDYTWGKIVLPFANEFSGWTLPASGSTAYDYTITGWEITSITGGTPGSWDGSYDLCNPDCTAKDLYANNNYVWAQGGNYVVPTGVTAITFTAHIARCVYLADSYVDIAYNGSYTSATNLGSQLTSDTYNGKAVYHSLSTAYAQLENKTNPADQAIVLVGNYHYNQAIAQDGLPAASGTTSYSAKAATIMSIDADNNQVPDYAFPQFHNVGSGRTSVPPLRFDFVCSPGIGISSYTRAGYLADVDILHSKGWFEVTETGMIHMTEFEIRPQNFTVSSPLILNGGIYDQLLQSTTEESAYNNNSGNNDKLSYIRIGGKAYVKKFWPGHKNSSVGMTINGKPINVSGGQIDMCYLTTDVHNKVINGDVNFYCNGGYIKEYLGAYQERITGNVTAKVDHALIDAFYGGGSDNAYGATAQIAGNIDNTINNSYVKFYCAGPKFGTMAAGKTVTTHATGTTFGEFYGAGYGGTALTRNLQDGESPTYGSGDFTFDRDWSNYTNNRLQYNTSYGTGVGYDFLFNMYAGGNHRGNASIYVNYATLSLASTRNVSSTLTNCTLEHDFYGGGCQGMVNGTITNTLTNCTVTGNVFGGGYKASATPIDVYPTTQPTYAVFKAAEGLFTEFGTTEPETYSWVAGSTDGTVDNDAKTISTTVDMAQMGKVTGEITTTVDGGTVGENVFGGGNESPSAASTKVEVKGTTTVGHDVYGGGNAAPVGASTDVLIDGTDVKINGSVFGGGLGEPATVGTNTKVQLKDKVNVTSNVYGGGNGGAVEGNTEVIIGEQ